MCTEDSCEMEFDVWRLNGGSMYRGFRRQLPALQIQFLPSNISLEPVLFD